MVDELCWQGCVCGHFHYNYLTSMNFLPLWPDPHIELTFSKVTSALDGPPSSACFLGMEQGLVFLFYSVLPGSRLNPNTV